MELVRARLEHDVDDRAGGPTIFGREGVRHHLEFLNGIDVGPDDFGLASLIGNLCVVVVDAVEQIVALGGAHPAAREAADPGPRRRLVGARRQQGELLVITSVERQVDDLLVVDDLSLGRLIRCEQRCLRRDRDLLRDFPHFQREIEGGGLLDLQHESRTHRAFKTGSFDRDAVFPNPQRHRLEGAVVTSHGFRTDVGLDVRHRHLGSADDASALVTDRAGDAGRFDLGPGDCARRE